MRITDAQEEQCERK